MPVKKWQIIPLKLKTMKIGKILLLSGSAVVAVFGAFASMHKAVKASKFSTNYYAKASGTTFVWTTNRPTGINCLSTTKSVYCTIAFTPTVNTPAPVNGQLPPSYTFTTPDAQTSLFKAH